jgi:hypothetical protein
MAKTRTGRRFAPASVNHRLSASPACTATASASVPHPVPVLRGGPAAVSEAAWLMPTALRYVKWPPSTFRAAARLGGEL